MQRSTWILAAAVGIMTTGLLSPLAAKAADSTDQAAIRKVMMHTWDKPAARLTVEPIVVLADHAIAGWTQAQGGGRALLARDSHGAWRVTLCAGDGLKDAKVLESVGMSAATARRMAEQLAKAEAAIPAQRRALFATFEGMVRMDASGNHPPQGAHGPGAKH